MFLIQAKLDGTKGEKGTRPFSAFPKEKSGANEAQVKAILGTLVDSVISWVEEGHSVRLGDLGSFVPNVTCKSSRDPGKIEIKQTKLLFYPSQKFARKIRNITLSAENAYPPSKEPKNR